MIMSDLSVPSTLCFKIPTHSFYLRNLDIAESFVLKIGLISSMVEINEVSGEYVKHT